MLSISRNFLEILSFASSLFQPRQSAWFSRTFPGFPRTSTLEQTAPTGEKDKPVIKRRERQKRTALGERRGRARAAERGNRNARVASHLVFTHAFLLPPGECSYRRFFFLPRSSFGLHPAAYSAISLERNFPGIRPDFAFVSCFALRQASFPLAGAAVRATDASRRRGCLVVNVNERRTTPRLTHFLRDIYPSTPLEIYAVVFPVKSQKTT